ncbi:transcription initiation factor TFIID subunit A-domain-containing protein [Xylariales sp. PMI_506]|nr:transcription initiation factor TFIID subunit A-domain-containing protein [Xylariales sp. PMI_506]
MNQQPQGQPAPGQPQAVRIPMYRPEQMQSLEILSDADKQKYEKGLRGLWDAMENNGPETPAHITARTKIQEFSRMVYSKVATMRRQQQLQQQQLQQQGGAGQPAQPNAAQAAMNQNLAAQRAAMAQQRPGGTNSANPGAGAAAPGQARPQGAPQAAQQPSHAVITHVNALNFVPPAHIDRDKAQAWRNDIRAKYTRALTIMETTSRRMKNIEALVKDRQEKGNPITNPEELKKLQDQVETDKKNHAEALKFIEGIRKNHIAPAAAQNAAQQRPPQAGQVAGNPMQAATASVNAAMDAAKNLQSGTVNRPQGAPQTPTSQTPTAQVAAQPAAAAAAQPGIIPTGQATVKVEPGAHPHPPPVNTALAAASNAHIPSAGTPTQNSARVQTPQSATPSAVAGPQGAARPLSHQAALSLANRQVSSNSVPMSNQSGTAGTTATTPGSAGGTSQQPAHTHAHPQPTPSAIQIKMPIPKQLPESTTQIPQATATGGGVAPGRPTMGNGTAIGGGTMGQPVISKTPAYTFETEGEHVLNKRKLDELVRQVCGGGPPGQDGNYLTPDVEESVNQVADHFIDNVMVMACRLAKERGSKVLEIRDLQLVLERVYNIRIPGYTSDELRTVRKPQPNGSWVSKISAVQAAKVTRDEK